MTQKIRFLHINKTGGSTLKVYLKGFKKKHPERDVEKYNHSTDFRTVCTKDADALIAFFIREPISRYASSFYSRMREGRPSHYRAWTSREKKAYGRFKTPNQLAEALSSWNPLLRYAAWQGMRANIHLRNPYAKVLGTVEYLEANRDRIGFILSQENYDADFAAMIRILELDPSIELPQDDKLMHKAPSGEDRALSDLARANLRKWFAKDFPVYEWCLQRRAEILKAHGEA